MIDILMEYKGKVFSPAVEEGLTLERERQGAPATLKFNIIRDENTEFQEGASVKLTVDGTDVFYGYVFAKEYSGSSAYNIAVTAYDQLRYFKNKATYVYKKKRANVLIQMIADDFKLKVGSLANTQYVIPKRTEDCQTLFDIAQYALDETLKNKGKLFVLYDDCGKLQLKNVANMKLDILLDLDTIGDYKYSTSIDGETYNRIKLRSESKKNGKRVTRVAKDDANIKEWGILQYRDKFSKDENGITKAKQLLKLYNKKTKTISLSDVKGDLRVRGGSSVIVKLDLDDTSISNYMMVEKVTHKLYNDYSTMDLTIRGGEFDA